MERRVFEKIKIIKSQPQKTKKAELFWSYSKEGVNILPGPKRERENK